MAEENIDLSAPPLPDEDPISSLLGTRVSQMNDQEIEEFVKKTRAARESPQVLRALLSAKPKAGTKAAAKVDLDILGL